MVQGRLGCLIALALLSAACGQERELPAGDRPTLRLSSFEVHPREVSPGEAVTVSWKTSRAKDVELFANEQKVALDGQAPASGSLAFPVLESTAFRLVARSGPSMVESETILVELQEEKEPLEIVSFLADPTEIPSGGTTTLHWETRNADSIRIVDGRGRPVNLQGEAPGEGSTEVMPEVSTSYTLIAERGEERMESLASVEVRQGLVFEIVSFRTRNVVPTPLGEKVLLEWHVRGAPDLITLSNREGEEHQVRDDQGSLEVVMGSLGEFELIATKGEQSVSETIVVPVLRHPVIGTFEATPEIATYPSETIRLLWSGVEHAESLFLHGDTVGTIFLANEEDGFVDLVVSENTTFTLYASNAAGIGTASTSITMTSRPSISYLKATPGRVGAGETFTLSWDTRNAKRITLETQDGPLDNVSDGMIQGGAVERQITEDTEFILRAFNEAGAMVEERLTVTVGAPAILSLTPSPWYAAPGQSVSFRWKVLGGLSLSLEEEDGTIVCSTSSLEEIEEGGCSVTAGGEGTHGYRLLVTNAISEVGEEMAYVVVGEGPLVVRFSVLPAELTAGEAVTASWLVVDDPLGLPLSVSLTDGDQDYPLPGGFPQVGSRRFPLESPGAYDFVFTASTPNGASVATAEVLVHPAPVATLEASSAVYEGTSPITLYWTSAHAETSLLLHELDGLGGLIHPPLLTIPEEGRGSGSIEVEPSRNTTYRIIATNAVGAKGTAETSVTLGPPEILAFEAEPQEVVAGDEMTLTWTTRQADGVALDFLPDQRIPTEVAEPYADISGTGTSLQWSWNCGWYYDPVFLDWAQYPEPDEGCATIPIPQGYAFPFGVNHHSVVVFANGAIGFDSVFTGTTYDNRDFPSSPYSPVGIAPFWEDQQNVQVVYSFGMDAIGVYLLVQWNSDLGLEDRSVVVADLNYQVILRENGDFGFRYGTMTAPDQGQADGSSATIGYQQVAGDFYVLHFGAAGYEHGDPVPGGLSGRSWDFAFPPTLLVNGSHTFQPSASTSLTLTAFGNGQTSEEIDIVVHPRALLHVFPPAVAAVEGVPFDLAWTTDHASDVEVFDGNGLRCAAAPAEVAAGSCALQEVVPGSYTYTVRATGALGHEVEEVLEVEVSSS